MSPDDQRVTFVELFFDLVFVFAVTKVTHYSAHHLDLHGTFHAVLVFWLIWWGWTQFAWALNAANTDHHHVRVATLLSTGVAFVMAFSVEQAFAASRADAAWFAISYTAVRVLGLALYYAVAYRNEEHRAAVATFAGLSATGLAAVIAGALVEPSSRAWFWLAAILLDCAAALVAGTRRAWGIHPAHFAERHGLIVIVGLGESLIVAGTALTTDVSRAVLATGGIAVAVTCLLWWTYFGWIRDVLEHALSERPDVARSQLARDAYSLWHFPLVGGIIALAVGFEGALHPDEYTLGQTTWAIGAGMALFLTATAGALWRAVGCVLWTRLAAVAATLGVLALGAASTPAQVLGIAGAGLAVVVTIEQLTVRRRLGHT